MATRSAHGSIANRLTGWFTISSFVMLTINSALAYWGFNVAMEFEDDEHLAHRVELVRTFLRQPQVNGNTLQSELIGNPVSGRFTEFLIRLMDASGKTIVETPGMDDELATAVFPKPVTYVKTPPAGLEIKAPSGQLYRIAAVEIPADAEIPTKHILHIAMNRTYEIGLMARQRLYLTVFLLITLAACAYAGRHIARYSLKPMAEMIRTARTIRSTTLGKRMDVTSMPIELAELAGTFNEMLDRLEDAFRRMSQFSSSIAHELRTPVNNLRGEAEVALGQARSPEEYRETMASILEESRRLGQLIDALLFLARSEDPKAQIQRHRIDVAEELTKLAEFHEAVAAEAKIRLEVHAAPDLVIEGDRTLFQRAVANLVTNALDHTPALGSIRITSVKAGNDVHIEVTDTGTGIPAESLPYVFDRFYRVDDARTGSFGRTGLGLAIVRSIAQLHRGSVAIESEVGRGTRVCLVFPLSSP